jgi:hypothetical protein
LATVIGLFILNTLQPGHLFFSLRYAMHIPQFIPQGAINSLRIALLYDSQNQHEALQGGGVELNLIL